MKAFISPDGNLNIRHTSLALLVFTIFFAVCALAVWAFLLWVDFHPALFSSTPGPPEFTLAALMSAVAIVFLIMSCWHVPFQIVVVFSPEEISMVKKAVFRSSSFACPLSTVDYFSFHYFWPYRAYRRSARISANLRSGKSVSLLTLKSISPCKRAHDAMKAYLSGLGRAGLVHDLPE